MTNESVFGSMCRAMMLALLNPSARAAITYSCSFKDKTMPRMTRASDAMPTSEGMIIISR